MTFNQEFINALNGEGCDIVGFAATTELHEDITRGKNQLITGIIMGAKYADDDTNEQLTRYETAAKQWLKSRGYRAVKKSVSLKMIGTLSGVGWVGRSAMLTTKECGSALRMVCLLTDAPFEHGTPIAKSLCPPDCMACRNVCPANAIINEKLWEVGMHRDEWFDVGRCKKGRSKCKTNWIPACIGVCPYNTIQEYQNPNTISDSVTKAVLEVKGEYLRAKQFEDVERKKRCETLLFNVENAMTRKVYDIDLAAMSPRNDTASVMQNGKLILTSDKKNSGLDTGLNTPQWFNGPIMISLRAKTNADILIFYSFGVLVLSAYSNDIWVYDIATSRRNGHLNHSSLPCDEFVDIEWVIAKDVMAIRVNGQLWSKSDVYPYIKKIKTDPNYEICSPVRINSAFGSTVTVESLRVTEL